VDSCVPGVWRIERSEGVLGAAATPGGWWRDSAVQSLRCFATQQLTGQGRNGYEQGLMLFDQRGMCQR
jgi:hypothetical protein